MRDAAGARAAKRAFVVAWLLVGIAKCVVAASLPLFVDEAFYWQEGRHLAWAYSDLPGLTAWLTRLGDMVMPGSVFGLRAPFLLIAAAVPWWVAHTASRACGDAIGWRAGLLAVLLPLSGSMGVLALPDVPLLLATVLCLDAGVRLLDRVDGLACVELALGLVIGGLTHYRFAAVIAVGLIALLLLRDGRRVLRQPRVWLAIGVGAVAWLPLLGWNAQNADAGLQFQLVDRHPWAPSTAGFRLGWMQLVLATPLLLAAMAIAAWRARRAPSPAQRFLAACGALIVIGFLLLGFVADRERVSFHWPLPGYVALLPLAAGVIARWPRALRVATVAVTAAGLAAVLGYYAMAATPSLRAQTSGRNIHPTNFAGWDALAAAVDARLEAMPPGTRLVAGNFKLGAELGHARGDAAIPVLVHPLNDKHGRAPQLALWGLLHATRASLGHAPLLLVVSPGDVPFRDLLAHYHAMCQQVGPLPAPDVVAVDHGRQRFLLFALPPVPADGPCTTPALAFVDAPGHDAAVASSFDVTGWAFKDGIGLAAVDVVLDGRVVARATYRLPAPGIAAFWKISTDPNHPGVGFRARVSGVAAGTHWLGLRLHGRDGSVEAWPAQPLRVRAD